jgi:hypothetical protein
MEPTVLNPVLYRTLKARFTQVVISSPGARGEITYYRSKGHTRMRIHHCEYYCVCCPLCKDHRPRLWISYMFGTFDARTRTRILHPAVCYHCNANAGDLYLADMIRPHFGQIRALAAPQVLDKPPELKPRELPEGQYCLLADLPATHPARAYLERRGYDCVELSERYYWMYYHDSPERFLARRIFIPILQVKHDERILVGYQSRAVPGLSVCEEPKYWTLPGFAKSQVLYNLDRAKCHDIVVLTEGVTDVARVGDAATAMLGKSLSMHQMGLLFRECKHARVAVMVDADAKAVGWLVTQQLNSGALGSLRLDRGAFYVPLPDGDPGSHTRAWLWDFIAKQDALSKNQQQQQECAK